MSAESIFDELTKSINNPDAKKLNSVYLFKLGDQEWTVDLKASPPTIKKGSHPSPDCTIVTNEKDFIEMAMGKIKGQTLFVQGKLKILGNTALAMKLDTLFKSVANAMNAKAIANATSSLLPVSTAPLPVPSPTAMVAAATSVATSAATTVASTIVNTANHLLHRDSDKGDTGSGSGLKNIFDQINKRISGDPGLAKAINGIYVFEITSADGNKDQWTLDLRSFPPSVKQGSPPEDQKPDVTVSVDLESFENLSSGKANPHSLFTLGKLKIKGSMPLAMKLDKIFRGESKL